MDKETLTKKRADVETRFKTQNEMKAQAEQEAYRLQGEYRLLTELIKSFGEEQPQEGGEE